MCGLKDYCHHGNRGDVAMDEKIPKMGSVVGILGHLASKHSQDIRAALMKLFQVLYTVYIGPGKLDMRALKTYITVQ